MATTETMKNIAKTIALIDEAETKMVHIAVHLADKPKIRNKANKINTQLWESLRLINELEKQVHKEYKLDIVR